MKNTSTKVADDIAKILCQSGSIIFRPSIPFRFTSGILSPVYVDNRRLISLPRERKTVIKYFVQIIKSLGVPDVIAGTATAGIPHAAWIAEELKLPMVYVRSEAKKHGRKNQVEGILKKGQKVIVIEDLVSTAGSSITTVKALRKLGANVKFEVAIYTHGLKEADVNFKKAKIKFTPLTNLESVLNYALKNHYLRSQDQVGQVLNWAKDPASWAQKRGLK